MPLPRARTFVTELVWDEEQRGTGLTEHGAVLSCGCPAEWVPEHLLCLAADSAFMAALLRLAAEAGLEVLGYVSQARFDAPPEVTQPPHVTLSPCIVVGSEEAARLAKRLCDRATVESPVSRLLHPRIQVSVDVRVVTAAETVGAFDVGRLGTR